MRAYTPQPELALIVALNTWVSSVLTNEWFHADVHAGNLLVLTDGRVAFIDFGIVGALPRKTSEAMLDFVRACVPLSRQPPHVSHPVHPRR